MRTSFAPLRRSRADPHGRGFDGIQPSTIRVSWSAKPPLAQRIIAAAAEGKLESAFSGSGKTGIQANASTGWNTGGW